MYMGERIVWKYISKTICKWNEAHLCWVTVCWYYDCSVLARNMCHGGNQKYLAHKKCSIPKQTNKKPQIPIKADSTAPQFRRCTACASKWPSLNCVLGISTIFLMIYLTQKTLKNILNKIKLSLIKIAHFNIFTVCPFFSQ